MASRPILESRAILMPSGDSPQVDLALRVSDLFVSLSSVYSETLQTLVLSQPAPECDRKDFLRHSKVLDDDEAYSVLLVIWRESPYVTDEALEKVKFARKFASGTLTAWRLATKLAESTETVGRTNTRVRAIGLAAEAFSLVERGTRTSTNKPLVGTERLHQFILTVSESQFRLIAELGPLLSLTSAGFDLPKQQ